MTAKSRLKNADLGASLEALQADIRSDPASVEHRVFLFQLLCVLGQWDRALTQLNVIADMDAGALAMVHTYRDLLQCEALRAAVFQGQRMPLVFGEPEEWIALVLEALRIEASGDPSRAQAMRAEAYSSAPVTSGLLDDDPFEWIADADSRIGPFLEAIVNGQYYWIPFHRIARMKFDEPQDLRDLVWVPVQFQWENGGEAVGFIPTRYTGTEEQSDDALRLARKTEWLEVTDGVYAGLGQRMVATDVEEYPLLDIRAITFSSAGEGS